MKANISRLILSAIMLTLGLVAGARVYLVSVGVTDYSKYPSKISNLNLPVADAEAVVDLYSKNTSVDYALLLNKKATKERIIKAMNKVYKDAKEDDQVVFFFSGHGYPGGFCVYDGNLGYDEIRKAMSKSKCKNKMMFVDACRSGGMRVDDEYAQNAVSQAKDSNVMLFLSSRNNENSIECADMQNGFFTTYLTKGLKGNADTDWNRVVTAKELFDFVSKGVKQISNDKQHPVMWGKFNDNMPVMKWK